ncbi:centromere protein U isoform X1 [Paroedura picta]|uniref:centromere protein U isoform X1 n=2 Tax=Paroedura picta TaxID=143630 RepID=UPI004057B353
MPHDRPREFSLQPLGGAASLLTLNEQGDPSKTPEGLSHEDWGGRGMWIGVESKRRASRHWNLPLLQTRPGYSTRERACADRYYRSRLWVSSNKMSKKKPQESRKKPGGCKTKLQTRDKWLPPEVPDVSRILKVPGNELEEESDEIFDPPLHSTAVSVYEDEEIERGQYSEHDESISNSSDNSDCDAPVPISKVAKRNHKQKSKNQLAIKSRRVIREDSESELVEENMMSRMTAKTSVQQDEGPSPEIGAGNIDPGGNTTQSVKIWHPNRFSRHVTVSDVILDEFEKITAQYKQGVEMKKYRKAIDSFYISFRDQLIHSSTEAEELRKTKAKRIKMVGKINKKRLRLIEVKEELIRTELQLKKLQRECTELKEKTSSARNARQFLKNLKDLQHEYLCNQKKTPQGKVEYGIHSLPALLVESRRILRAESHFRSINSKLQQMLAS